MFCKHLTFLYLRKDSNAKFFKVKGSLENHSCAKAVKSSNNLTIIVKIWMLVRTYANKTYRAINNNPCIK